jgi:hypothetical protein
VTPSTQTALWAATAPPAAAGPSADAPPAASPRAARPGRGQPREAGPLSSQLFTFGGDARARGARHGVSAPTLQTRRSSDGTSVRGDAATRPSSDGGGAAAGGVFLHGVAGAVWARGGRRRPRGARMHAVPRPHCVAPSAARSPAALRGPPPAGLSLGPGRRAPAARQQQPLQPPQPLQQQQQQQQQQLLQQTRAPLMLPQALAPGAPSYAPESPACPYPSQQVGRPRGPGGGGLLVGSRHGGRGAARPGVCDLHPPCAAPRRRGQRGPSRSPLPQRPPPPAPPPQILMVQPGQGPGAAPVYYLVSQPVEGQSFAMAVAPPAASMPLPLAPHAAAAAPPTGWAWPPGGSGGGAAAAPGAAPAGVPAYAGLPPGAYAMAAPPPSFPTPALAAPAASTPALAPALAPALPRAQPAPWPPPPPRGGGGGGHGA